MKIREEADSVNVSTLISGDVFKCNGNYYMRCLSNDSEKVQVVNLTTGIIEAWYPKDNVTPVNGEFVVGETGE
jgi:hypothetical protein